MCDVDRFFFFVFRNFIKGVRIDVVIIVFGGGGYRIEGYESREMVYEGYCFGYVVLGMWAFVFLGCYYLRYVEWGCGMGMWFWSCFC